MRNPRAFLRPLAVGAPTPSADVPFRPSRMIHFFDPSNEKMQAKVPDIAPKVDIILGNLIASVLVPLARLLRDELRPGGALVASGIFVDREAEVVDAFQQAFHDVSALPLKL